jgi:hypothetical protein
MPFLTAPAKSVKSNTLMITGYDRKCFGPELVVDDSRDIEREHASGIDDLAEIDVEDHTVTLADPCARPR